MQAATRGMQHSHCFSSKFSECILIYRNLYALFHTCSRIICRSMLSVCTQVQHGMGPLINMQKSVFLPLWDDYELYDRKILHIESFSAIESENLVRISKFFV